MTYYKPNPAVGSIVRLWYGAKTRTLFAPLHGRHARVVAVCEPRRGPDGTKAPRNVAVLLNPRHAPPDRLPGTPIIVPVGNCFPQGYEPKTKKTKQVTP